MSIKICLQSGHWNKAGAGAPEEQANNKRITDRVASMLRDRKFEVLQTDYFAYNDTKVTKVDFNLFLALHCDMDYANDGGSGFADFPQPATDGATKESQRIVGIINDVYFRETKINYKNRSNDNTRYYYMWKWITPKTPCALLEMGQSIDPHDKVLLANTDLIASSIVRALCKAFNIPYDLTPQVPPVVVTPPAPSVVSADDTLIDLGSPLGIKTLRAIKDGIATLDQQLDVLDKKNIQLDGDNATLVAVNRDLKQKIADSLDLVGQLSIKLS